MLLSVGRIQQSGVFGNDNDILRRIAYVETRDRVHSGTFREGYDGGIWAVNEGALGAPRTLMRLHGCQQR